MPPNGPELPAVGAASVDPGAPAAVPNHSYGQILRSSVLIGGSSAFNIAFGIVRSKAVALILGPAGFGLMGLYTSIANLAQSVASMGINSSGVRQIAAAVGSGDTDRIGRTAAVLRRVSVLLGLAGALLLVALSGRLSTLTFGSSEGAAPVALLSLAVFLRVVSDGRGALIQGMRRISDLATITVLGGLCGTLLTIALVYVWGERGVVPSLIATAGASLLFFWWYSRRIVLAIPVLAASQVRQEAGALLRLGFAFMASGMLMMGSAYAVRLIIVRQIGLEAAGFYQSAWTVGALYVGFILDAMGTDFYPRLTGVIRNRGECNRLVNEQAQISLLLAGPGVLATLTFAPLVIPLFYSAAFREAVGLLRWLCLGATLRVITWPMGFIIVADARQSVFLLVELAYVVVYLTCSWVCIRYLGIDGAGVAFVGSYVFHGLLVYPIVRRISGFRWSAANLRLGASFLVLIISVFCAFRVLAPWLATSIGCCAVLGNGLYAIRTLVHLVSPERLPRPIRRLAAWMRLSP